MGNSFPHGFRIPIIIVGNDLKIQYFSPRSKKIMEMLSIEKGKPIRQIKLKITPDKLERLIRDALDTSAVIKIELQDQQDHWYHVHIMPNTTYEEKIDGVIMRLVDINMLKCSHAEVKDAHDYPHAVIETMPTPLLILDKDFRVLSANESFYITFKCSESIIKGRLIYELDNHSWNTAELRTLLHRTCIREFDVCRNFLTIGQRTMLINASQIWQKDKKDHKILLSIEDITGIKKAKEEMSGIECLLTKNLKSHSIFKDRKPGSIQHYGRVTEHNVSKILGVTLGKKVLIDMLADCINLLKTSAAIYEKKGGYTLGFLASDWCQLLNSGFGLTSNTNGERDTGEREIPLCHKYWTMMAKSVIERGTPCEFICPGGLNIYALPIWAAGEIIGCNYVSYGAPPREIELLQEIAHRFMISEEEVFYQAKNYESRPSFIIEIAKSRLFTLAELTGALVERSRGEDKSSQHNKQYQKLFQFSSHCA
ncbi:MAG: PAS domain-containing protein [bacterium]